jgi:hypothetical protein
MDHDYDEMDKSGKVISAVNGADCFRALIYDDHGKERKSMSPIIRYRCVPDSDLSKDKIEFWARFIWWMTDNDKRGLWTWEWDGEKVNFMLKSSGMSYAKALVWLMAWRYLMEFPDYVTTLFGKKEGYSQEELFSIFQARHHTELTSFANHLLLYSNVYNSRTQRPITRAEFLVNLSNPNLDSVNQHFRIP